MSDGDKRHPGLAVKSQTTNAIVANEVSVTASGVTLLPPTSFTASAGRAAVVRGKNGTGKSTLLRVLSGLRVPSSGNAAVLGADVRRPDRTFRRRVAAMIDLPPMAPDLTVQDHVDLVAATWFSLPEQRKLIAQRVLASLELNALNERFPHELSSGQRQLFGLSLTLSRPFDVLILDEPEQRLDDERLGILTKILSGLRDEGRTLVIATHSDVLTDRLADQVVALEPVR